MTIGSARYYSKSITNQGACIVYNYVSGIQPSKPVTVFIHGWAGSGADWEEVIPEYIASEEGVLVFDAAGFGDSHFENGRVIQNSDFTLERYVADLAALLEAEGIERVNLVGHSWGGVVAMCFAARYPLCVEKLVTIGSAYFDPENLLHQTFKWVSYVIGQLLVFSKPLLRRSKRLRKIAVRRYFYHSPDSATAELLVKDALDGCNKAIVQTLLTGYDVHFKVICPNILCPTLYIGSDKDAAAPLPYVKAFVPLTPLSSFQVIKECGHFPMLEQPQELLNLLTGFLA